MIEAFEMEQPFHEGGTTELTLEQSDDKRRGQASGCRDVLEYSGA